MRRFFVVMAATAITIVGLSNPVAESSDADQGALQDMLDYASSFSRKGDSLRAIIVYDIMLHAFSRNANTQNLAVVCQELVTNVPPEDVHHFNRSFWDCPEGLLTDWLVTDWLGSIDPFRTVEPVLIRGNPPRFPPRTEVPEGSVLVSFDISESGSVENIQILESSIAVWEQPTLDAIRKWKYSPALYNGKPVRKNGLKQKFTFQYE